jgi:histidyl-tRNA synthetase
MKINSLKGYIIMKTSTVKGTNDYLPKEVALREFLQNSILETYRSNGFERIMTPALEDIENLEKSDGGDNLNLMFKILKRGEKLKSALKSASFGQLSDMGLRYDLTLPLSRYYANNRQKLLTPFKCIQIDKAYRAEKPQKGRLREYVQCDIDIIGSDSVYCEIELRGIIPARFLKLKALRLTAQSRGVGDMIT